MATEPIDPSVPHTHDPHFLFVVPGTRTAQVVCCLCGTLGLAPAVAPPDDGHGPYAPRVVIRAQTPWNGSAPRWNA